MSVLQDIYKTAEGIWSLVVGLRITAWNFARPQVTVHYPRKVVGRSLATFRGHIELVGKEKNPAEPRCITCMLCEGLCPSGCIKIHKPKPVPKAKAAPAEKLPEADGSAVGAVLTPKKMPPPAAPGEGSSPKAAAAKEPKAAPASKVPLAFTLNYTLCSLCGLCVQNCPADSLRFSNDVYLAELAAPQGSGRQAFQYDLLERLRRQAQLLGPGAASLKAPAQGSGAEPQVAAKAAAEEGA